MSRLQKKPPAHKIGHPTLQNMNFFYFCGSFLPSWIRILICIQITDPDPDPMVRLNTDPIRIRIRNTAYKKISFSSQVLFCLLLSEGSLTVSILKDKKLLRRKNPDPVGSKTSGFGTLVEMIAPASNDVLVYLNSKRVLKSNLI
jgi:hypothetical protein